MQRSFLPHHGAFAAPRAHVVQFANDACGAEVAVAISCHDGVELQGTVDVGLLRDGEANAVMTAGPTWIYGGAHMKTLAIHTESDTTTHTHTHTRAVQRRGVPNTSTPTHQRLGVGMGAEKGALQHVEVNGVVLRQC